MFHTKHRFYQIFSVSTM